MEVICKFNPSNRLYLAYLADLSTIYSITLRSWNEALWRAAIKNNMGVIKNQTNNLAKSNMAHCKPEI